MNVMSYTCVFPTVRRSLWGGGGVAWRLCVVRVTKEGVYSIYILYKCGDWSLGASGARPHLLSQGKNNNKIYIYKMLYIYIYIYIYIFYIYIFLIIIITFFIFFISPESTVK